MPCPQQRLARSHEVDKARAARLSEFSAAGWSATLAISDLARTPIDDKEAVEATDRFQALSDRFNAALPRRFSCSMTAKSTPLPTA